MIKNICGFLNGIVSQFNSILFSVFLCIIMLFILFFINILFGLLIILSPIISLIPFCITNPFLTYLITRYYNYVKYFVNRMSNVFLNLLPNIYRFLDKIFMKEYFLNK